MKKNVLRMHKHAKNACREGDLEQDSMLVEDPYEPGGKVQVKANVHHDVLVHWKARKQIDDAQFLAGLKLQKLWYKAETGMISAVRFDCERVDVSTHRDPFTERRAIASGELREIASFLGRVDYRLITRILCEGRRIDDEARELGGRQPQLYVARRVRDALSYLADYWGTLGKSHIPSQDRAYAGLHDR